MKGKKEQIDNGAKRYRSPKETMQFLNYYVTIHQITSEEEEAFAAAPASYDDMAEEDWQKEHEAQIEGERQLKDEEEFKAIKRTLHKGIEGKRSKPDSELFRSSKDLLDRVTRFQSDPSSVTQHEMRKFEDDLSVYFSLWRGEDDKRSESASAEKPAETGQSTALGKLGWIRGLLWRLYDATVKSALEWLWTKIFSGPT